MARWADGHFFGTVDFFSHWLDRKMRGQEEKNELALLMLLEERQRETLTKHRKGSMGNAGRMTIKKESSETVRAFSGFSDYFNQLRHGPDKPGRNARGIAPINVENSLVERLACQGGK
jgi:hypothetical protein